jgi:hypothetical protein
VKIGKCLDRQNVLSGFRILAGYSNVVWSEDHRNLIHYLELLYRLVPGAAAFRTFGAALLP